MFVIMFKQFKEDLKIFEKNKNEQINKIKKSIQHIKIESSTQNC